MWDKNGNVNGKALFVMLCCTVFTVGFLVVSLNEFLQGAM